MRVERGQNCQREPGGTLRGRWREWGGGQQVGTRHSDQRLGWSFSGGEEPLAYEVGVHRGASWLRHYKLAGLL